MMLELTDLTIFSPRVQKGLEGLRIIQVSDLHTRGWGKNERCLKLLLRQKHDLLLITGDFCWQVKIGNILSSKDQDPPPVGFSRRGYAFPPRTDIALEVSRRLMQDYNSPLGVFAIQGNHDPDDFMEQLPALGIKVLVNETVQLELGGGCFNLGGLRCYGFSGADIPRMLLGIQSELLSIVACHYPDMAPAIAAAHVDLILCGHTHGGQVCLPGRVPITTHSQTGRKYASGLANFDGCYIYTNRGLGFSPPPVRLFCPPEITRITFRHDEQQRTELSVKVLSLDSGQIQLHEG